MSKRWTAADIPQKHQAEAARQLYPEGHCVSVPAEQALREICGMQPIPKPMSGGVVYQETKCDEWKLVEIWPAIDRSKWTPAQLCFIALCEAEGIETPVPEYRFHPTRKWRTDFAFVSARLLLEIDGGLFVNGGHTRGAAREHDFEKDCNALIMGYRVMRVSTGQLKSGLAMTWLKAILATYAEK
jgi:hypothetical protein